MERRDTSIFVERVDIGPPNGLTVAIKDCIDIAGYPTRSGSAVLAGRAPATAHADVVAAMVQGGARIVGKANMHELAYGVTGINAAFGTPVNPRYPALIPGGSSSGSAVAVAAGLVQVAIGTDTGGSIRMPACCCGIIGLKPTFGRVSRRGCEPERSSLDCIGPLARDMDGIEAAMCLVDPTFLHTARQVSGIRLGVVRCDADDAVQAIVAAAVERTAIAFEAIDLPLLDEAFHAGMVIIAAESRAAFGALTADARMGADVRARLIAATAVTPDQVAQAEAVRARFTVQVDAALADVDALVLPTLPVVPPALDELDDAAAVLRLTALIRPFNLSGHPAITLPLDGPDGRPVGLQIVGRRGADADLCAIARSVLRGILA